MTEITPSVVPHTSLPDPWGRGPIPLDGVLERGRWAPLLTAFLVLFAGLVAFQTISAVVTVVLLAARGVSLARLMEDLPGVMEEQAGLILTANTIGQVLGLALVALLAARLHSSRSHAFLRLRTPDGASLVLGVAGLFALLPFVMWLGTVNQSLPLPEALRELEESQMELIERVLLSDLGVLFNLVMLAVTPALCEELIFRGYAQRQAERSLGVVGAILFTGLFFGAYHLRLTQVLPLSVLGFYLAYLAWRTGSLWVPVAVHFANNGFAVVLGAVAASRPDLDLAELEQEMMPWYVVVSGVAVFALVMVLLHRRTGARLAGAAPPNAYPEPIPDHHV